MIGVAAAARFRIEQLLALEARLERIECALVELAAKNGSAPAPAPKPAAKATSKKR
jgi:hypothetical protein